VTPSQTLVQELQLRASASPVCQLQLIVSPRLQQPHKFFGLNANVFEYFAEEIRRNVATTVVRNCRNPTICMPELLVRTSLSDFYKP
jgi:hypothetical protein